jgi:hypothetical protein
MRELQKAFHPDPVDFRVREEENGVPEVQEPQSQTTDLLLPSSDFQEKLDGSMEINSFTANSRNN